MTEPYFNASYGTGLEGFINYTNLLVDGWMINLFLLFIFIATTFTLAKSEWKMSGVLAFTFFLEFITILLLRMFVEVNGMLLYIAIIGLAVSVFAGMWTKNKF